jgi:hypothetical protein
MRHLNKEYKVDVCDNISLKYGSVNRDNPQVIYVSGKCWVLPLAESLYCNVIRDIEKSLKNSIKTYLANGKYFEKDFIFDFDINTDNMKIGEKKFLSFDFYLRQTMVNKKTLKELRNLFNEKLSFIADNLNLGFNEHHFCVERKK